MHQNFLHFVFKTFQKAESLPESQQISSPFLHVDSLICMQLEFTLYETISKFYVIMFRQRFGQHLKYFNHIFTRMFKEVNLETIYRVKFIR